MSNYEWLVQKQTQQTTYSVPTAAMFAGDFSGPGLPIIYDPTTQDPASPATKFTNINPISKKLLQYYDSRATAGLDQ